MAESYKYKGHTFNHTFGGKKVCSSCGLFALNNPLTQWFIDKGCLADIHPDKANAIKRLSRGLDG